MTNSSFKSSKFPHCGGDAVNNTMTMIQIIAQEEKERRNILALHEETILREERLLHEETMIQRHQQMEKEVLILGNPCRLRAQLDKGTENGRVMKEMMKYLVNLE